MSSIIVTDIPVASSSKARRRLSLTVLLPWLLIVVLTAVSFFVPDGADPLVIWPCLLIYYAIVWDAIRRPTRVHPSIPTYMTIEVMFLVFFFLLYYMPYQLAVLDLFDLSQSRVRNNFVWKSNQAVVTATVGLVAFYFGMKWRPAGLAPANAKQLVTTSYRFLPHLTVAALICFIWLYTSSGWRSSGEGRYTDTISGGVLAEGVSILILMFSMIAIALPFAAIAQRKSISLITWLGLIPALYWCLRLLAAGDRNSFLLLAIVGIGGLLTFKFKGSRFPLVLMLLAGLQIYNAVEVLRMSDGIGLGDIIATAATTTSDASDESSFNTTTITARAALYAVPAEYDFGYGIYKLNGIAGIIPLVRGLIIGNSDFATTSTILTLTMLGPESTWGVGTNVVSDIYMDFGIVGIPIVMYLLGCFAGWTRNAVTQSPTSTSAIVLYLVTMALFTELPRYTVDFPVRILAWTMAFFWLYRLFFRSKVRSAA